MSNSGSHVPPFVEAFSGSVGASLANVLVYPLDLVASRMQTKPPQQLQKRVDPEATRTSSTAKRDATASDLIATIRSIYASSGNGLAGFYQGIASDTLSTALSNFLFFYMHAALSALATRRLRQIASHDKGAVDSVVMKLSGGKELLIGVLAGVASRGITTPLSVITVRKQTASKVASKPEHPGANETAVEDEDDYDSDWASDSSVAIARDIYAEMGISGFWRGYSSACLLTINPAITFFLIAAFKRAFVPARFRSNPSQLQTFFISAFASAIASTLCYPMILAKTRLQWKSPTGKLMYRNMADVFRKTLKKSGLKGLYVGLEAQIAKGFLSQGVTMVLKQRTELTVIALYTMLLRARRGL